MSDPDEPNDEQEGVQAAGETTPAADLGELWQALDSLPQAEPADELLATTIEMVAVQAKATSGKRPGAGSSRFSALRRDLWQWLAPGVAVLAAILAGYWLGQATAVGPASDRERAEWRARREAALKESLKNDPEARRLLREKLREVEGAAGLRPVGSQPPGGSRPRPANRLRPPGPRFQSEGPKKPAGPRRRFPEPPAEPGVQPPAPPAAGPGAATPPSPPSPPAA